MLGFLALLSAASMPVTDALGPEPVAGPRVYEAAGLLAGDGKGADGTKSAHEPAVSEASAEAPIRRRVKPRVSKVRCPAAICHPKCPVATSVTPEDEDGDAVRLRLQSAAPSRSLSAGETCDDTATKTTAEKNTSLAEAS